MPPIMVHRKSRRSTALVTGGVAIATLIIVPFQIDLRIARAQPPVPSQPMNYPTTTAGDISDDYFGNAIADPYRWLEDTESDATADWIAAQNKITDRYLDTLPSRAAFVERLRVLWNYERYGTPTEEGDRYIYFHNDGLQDQSILYKADSLNGQRTVLIDANNLSEDGTVALSSTAVSDDGRYVAYGLADGGSDWRTWKVREIDSGKDTDDVVQWSKFSSIAWAPDGSGFYYGRYASPTEGAELLGTNENQQVYFHQLATPQDDDTLIYARPDYPQWGFSPTVTEDGRFLILQNWKGSEPKAQIFYKDLQSENSEVQELITGFDADYSFVAADGDQLYFMTDRNAPKQQLIAVPIGDSKPNPSQYRTVIPEQDEVLQSVTLFGDTFYAVYLKDAASLVRKFTLDGTDSGTLELPGLGTVGGLDGKRDASETFFTFENYSTPQSIYRLDLATGDVTPWRTPDVAINADQFVTEQIFATSKDGTQIPVTITRRKDAAMDGTNPTLLYGYGGFNISIVPRFSPGVAAWIDDGGIYAVATLRGGGEYGRDWHESGMRLNKQNVFNDCIAAAEALVDANYCTPKTLALYGRSNGGLLVGAVMTQRPDLFGAVLPAVGVMDMLRYHKFTIGWAWSAEFGDSDEQDQIENLLSYSPLHNISPGTCYPATMVMTADRDDRVVPGHSFKFAATLQTAQAMSATCDNPVLIRIETRAGHGAGTPVSKQIQEYADMWSFLKKNLVPAKP